MRTTRGKAIYMRSRAKYQNSKLSVNIPHIAVTLGSALFASLMMIGSAGAQDAPALTPGRFVINADGKLVQQSGPMTGADTTPNTSPADQSLSQSRSSATSRLPDGMPDVATPIVSSRAGTATIQPNTSVRPGPTVAAPDGTAAAQAVAQARQAMNNKQWAQLSNLIGPASSDVLGIYPEYWHMRTQIGSAHMPGTQEALMAFLKKNQGAFLADRLRGEWILASARAGDFTTVRELSPVINGNNQISCAQLEAQHMTGQRATAAEATKVFVPGGACWKLFDQLVADKVMTGNELLPYLQDFIENNKVTEARRIAAYLFNTSELAAYDAMMRDPQKWLATQNGDRSTAINDIVAIALARVARNDLSAAEDLVRSTWANKLPRLNLQWVYGQFASLAVFSFDPRAYSWYRETSGIRLSETNHAWRIRAALKQAKIDWNWVQRCIDQMSQTQRNDPAWVYWKARALAAQGKENDAKQLYESISHHHNFYGQLASEELGRAIVAPEKPSPLTAEEIEQARQNLGLRRAVTLFKRGWRGDAVPEWNFAIRGMTDRQLMAAAELARHEHIYDRVVNTSDRTSKEFDFSQRYIAPFEGRVTAQAREIDIDPAWVYGLIRQESRFIMDARSVVGASGLMQLMPATAKWVAKKIGMTDFTPQKVNDFDTNTKLGTNYLSMVLADLGGSQVLASAGYNAGPGRPMLWRSKLDTTTEGAIFAETIPFNETRDYVKNVLSNATYYAALFTGQPQSLKQRLGQIAPQPYGRNQ